MAHLYASFADASLAEKAAGALLDYGVRQEDVSVVANDAYGQARTSYGTDTTGTAANPWLGAANPGAGALGATEAAGNQLAGTGDRMAGAVTGALGATGTATGYAEAANERTGDRAGLYDAPTPVGADLNPLDQGAPDSATDFSLASEGGVEAPAKHGISTTTPEDAGEGAVKGTGIGLGVGILASLAALAVPGVGLVLGGGALAAALGATALTAGAGAIAGGVTGYLKDQGVPGEAAERYHGTIQSGGAVLSLSIPSGKVDQATAEQVLSKYGASDVGAY